MLTRPSSIIQSWQHLLEGCGAMKTCYLGCQWVSRHPRCSVSSGILTTIYPRFSTVCSLSCPTLIISFPLELLTAAFCHLWCCLDGLLILLSPGPYVQSPCLQIPLGRFSFSSLAALLPCGLLRYTRTSSSQMYCHKGLWVWQSRSFVFRSEPQVSPQVGDGNF